MLQLLSNFRFISDHEPLKFIIRLNRGTYVNNIIPQLNTYRNWRRADWNSITKFLLSQDWSLIYSNTVDLQNRFNVLYNFFHSAIDQYVPVMKHRASRKLPWVTTGMIKIKSKRNAHFKRWEKFGDIFHFQQFKIYDKIYLNLTKNARQKYIEKISNQLLTSDKIFWNVLPSFTTRKIKYKTGIF